ncbi:ABC transporter ATP-binding protein [Bacillus piscicola]|uniref:ABC transporter ATP-binding protein n=1 Tax=Bacillus piscicola TaxID=1632684 RepID=UPI001F095A7E|nr:ABC transporter ATP-binding protein [Bacillus piscicola]
METAMLSCQHLQVHISHHVILHRINLAVQHSEIVCVVGPSGCGKTTLLRAIAGMVPVSAGQVLLEGVNITRTKPERRPVVMMHQEALLFPHMTVIENITYGLKLQKIPKKERERQGMQMLNRVEMADYENVYPHALSGGQQQRVAFARALITKPKLILFDEPFSSLDPLLRRSLGMWMKGMLKEEGMTALFVTHDKEEAMMLSDRVAVMVEGAIHQIGPPLDVYQRPLSVETAVFFSEGMLLDNRFFITNDAFTITADSSTLKEKKLVFKGHIAGKWLRSGQLFYHIVLDTESQELILPGEATFSTGDKVFIEAPEQAVVDLEEIR